MPQDPQNDTVQPAGIPPGTPDIATALSNPGQMPGSVPRVEEGAERNRVEQQNAVLQRLGRSLSSAKTDQEAARVITEAASELFPWDACALHLYDAEADLLSPVLVIDTLDNRKIPVENHPHPTPSSMARRVLENGAELLLRSPEELAGTDGYRFGNSSRLSASLMNVPIRNASKTIGILSIQSYSLNAYKERDLQVLESLADYCAGALERIHAESELYSSQVRFHSVWENSVDGMRLTDEHGTIVAVNEAYCKLVGMPREELIGQPFTVTYAETENLESFLKKYQLRFQQGKLQKQATRRMKFRSGKIVDLEDTNSFIDSQDGRPLLLALFRDITTQKRLEEELRQSQKMESIGQLAGGIAHDFNNILTVINGHASLLLMSESMDESTRESVEQISRSAERAANLTRQLLAFSRKQKMEAQKLDLNEVVDEMTKILRRVLGEDICLRVNYSVEHPIIHADRGMMEQILLNLVVNSRDAMPRGGNLSIETSIENINPAHPEKPAELPAGQYVRLQVEDTGAGIPPDLLTKIFEPFFTTKDVGKGTGLGLATVYGIVKQHRGFIHVTSNVNQGTTFDIYIPTVTGQMENVTRDEKKGASTGLETILLVEDEAGVRMLATSVLKRLGYQVLGADSGVSALAIWKERCQDINLVLTDLVMPDGISGRELAECLRADRPDIHVIFTSGYPREDAVKLDTFRKEINFLQKPYHPDTLAQMVRQCLDQGKKR